jgi:hypothetical protein
MINCNISFPSSESDHLKVLYVVLLCDNMLGDHLMISYVVFLCDNMFGEINLTCMKLNKKN